MGKLEGASPVTQHPQTALKSQGRGLIKGPCANPTSSYLWTWIHERIFLALDWSDTNLVRLPSLVDSVFSGGLSAAPEPSTFSDVLDKTFSSIWGEFWAFLVSSPLALGTCLLVVTAIVVKMFRIIRWAPLAIGGRDQVRRFSAADRAFLMERAGNRCERHFLSLWRCPATQKLQADHIHPHSKGGRTHIRNGQLLCARHNKEKSARIPFEWQLRLLARNRASYFPAGMDGRVIRGRVK